MTCRATTSGRGATRDTGGGASHAQLMCLSRDERRELVSVLSEADMRICASAHIISIGQKAPGDDRRATGTETSSPVVLIFDAWVSAPAHPWDQVG